MQQVKTTLRASPGKSSLWRNRWSSREGWWTSVVSSTLERSLLRPNVSPPCCYLKEEQWRNRSDWKCRDFLKVALSSTYVKSGAEYAPHGLDCVCLFSPAEKPATEPHTQPSRLSASSSSSDSSSSSSSSSSSDTSDSDSGWEAEGFRMRKGHARGPEHFASHRVDWTAVELLMMEPQDGSDETSTRQNWSDSTSVKPRKREGAFPALNSFIRSCHGHRSLGWMNEWKEGRLIAVLWRTGLVGQSEGRSISCKIKKGEERSMRWRDKGARARICLISGDNFPSSRALCLYAV